MSVNYTITEAAKKILEDHGDLLSIEDIHEQVLSKNLYDFKEGANSLHILTGQVNRKCINSNLSYKNKDLIFYYNEDNDKYGLLEWLSPNESEQYFSEEIHEDLLKQQVKNLQNTIIDHTKKLQFFDKSFEDMHAFIELADNAKQKLEDLTASYEAKIKLHAAKQYWEDKKNTHKDSIWKFILAFLISIAGVIAIDTWLYNHFEISTDSINIFHFGLIIFTTSIGIWISRILLKILLSNLHLSEEANEKETMILTYLALIKEGAGLEENDRKIILDAIFRPSSNGIIKDDSNVTILDVINVLKAK